MAMGEDDSAFRDDTFITLKVALNLAIFQNEQKAKQNATPILVQKTVLVIPENHISFPDMNYRAFLNELKKHNKNFQRCEAENAWRDVLLDAYYKWVHTESEDVVAEMLHDKLEQVNIICTIYPENPNSATSYAIGRELAATNSRANGNSSSMKSGKMNKQKVERKPYNRPERLRGRWTLREKKRVETMVDQMEIDVDN